jgi:hypothetical protein
MISKKDEISQNRKFYVKPKMEQVKLVAEEAVITFCKVSSNNGPTGAGCKPHGSACINANQGS